MGNNQPFLLAKTFSMGKFRSHIEYCSRDCETWYQKHLAAIQSGTADLKSQAQWKQGIQFMRLSLTAGQKNELLTAQSLDIWCGDIKSELCPFFLLDMHV
jgi:hypothetical protein